VVSSHRADTERPSLGPLLRRALSPAGGAEIDDTAERILAGALAQFEDFGVRRTTMEDVARRVGMSRVTIYRRFSNKDALVEAVLSFLLTPESIVRLDSPQAAREFARRHLAPSLHTRPAP
jgi:AcrR family transcriptional regulator